jgi:hypothetical protein
VSPLATELRMWNNYDLGKQNLLLVRMKFLLVD